MVTRPDRIPIQKNIAKKETFQVIGGLSALIAIGCAFGGNWFLALLLGGASFWAFDYASNIKTHKVWVGAVDAYR